jgi:uncharacterized membrane protein YgcG
MAWLIALLAAMPGFSGYVVDPAGAIGAPEAARIATVCARLDKAQVAQVAVAAVTDLEGMDRKQYAVELFRKWRLGHGARADDGLLILILAGPAGHRGLKVEVGYGLEGILPDGKVGAIIDEVAGPAMRAGRFGEAAAALVDRFASELEKSPAAQCPVSAPAAPALAPAPAPVPAAGVEKSGNLLRDHWVWPLLAIVLYLFTLHFRERQPSLLAVLATVPALWLGATSAREMDWVYFCMMAGALPMLMVCFFQRRCRKDGGWLKDTTSEVLKPPTDIRDGLERVTQVCNRCGFTRTIEREIFRDAPSGGSSSGHSRAESGQTSGSSGGSSGGGSGSSGGGGGSGFSGGGGGRSGGGGADRDY